MDNIKNRGSDFGKVVFLVLSIIASIFFGYNIVNQFITGEATAIGSGGSTFSPQSYTGESDVAVIERDKFICVTLQDGEEGGPYIDLMGTGGLNNVIDYYQGMLNESKENSLYIASSRLASSGNVKGEPWYVAGFNPATNMIEYSADPSETARISSTPAAQFYPGIFYDSIVQYVQNGGNLGDLAMQDATTGNYGFVNLVNAIPDHKPRSQQLWAYFASQGSVAGAINQFLNTQQDKWNDTASMSAEEKTEQTYRYLDLLMTLYSVAEGSSAQPYWEQGVVNYITSGGSGTLTQNSDNKSNLLISPGCIFKSTRAGMRGCFWINTTDAVNGAMLMTPANNLTDKSVADEVVAQVGSPETYAELLFAYQRSVGETPGNNEARLFRSAKGFFNSALTNMILSYRPNSVGAPTGLEPIGGTSRHFLDELSVTSTGGVNHYGINIALGLPMSASSVKSNMEASAFWSGGNTNGGGGTDTGKDARRTSLLFGNTWEESDKNKMYNSNNSDESSTLANYKGSIATGVRANRLLETISDNINISLLGNTETKTDWNNIIQNNNIFKIKIDYNRTQQAYDFSSGNDVAVNGYGFNGQEMWLAGKQYTTGSIIPIGDIGWTKENLRAFLFGQKSLDLSLDKSTYNQLLKDKHKAIYKYNIKLTILYGNSENDLKQAVMSATTNEVEAKRIDYPVPEPGIRHVSFHSEPLAYSELKEGTVQMDGDSANETWEAMAGVPSTETLYFASGGSEFIVEVHMSYIPKERAKRTYKSRYEGIECEYKKPDTMNQGNVVDVSGNVVGGSLGAVPTVSDGYGKTAGVWTDKNIQCTHTGFDNTIVITWEGESKCENITSSCSVCGGADIHRNHVLDPSDYQNAKSTAQSFVSAINSSKVSWTSGSDKKLREYNWSASITTDNQDTSDNTNVGDDGSAGCGDGHDECGGCVDAEGNSTCESGDAHSTGSKCPGHHPWKIVVTATIPSHVVCGPCCNHNLPAIEDNWTQEFEYSYMRIDSVKTWKIDRSYVDGMEDITYHETEIIKNDIIQGDPNIFYNIADMNTDYYNQSRQQLDYFMSNADIPDNAFVTVGSQAGRLRYTLQSQQHDAVTWAENQANQNRRTNKCNGDSGCGTNKCPQNPVPVPDGQGHKNPWSVGCLYSNTNQVNDEQWRTHTYVAKKEGTGLNTTATWDDVDAQTTEYKKFVERRGTNNTVAVMSDMLILQTSTGDQSVLYFNKTQTRKSDKHFDYDKDDYGKWTGDKYEGNDKTFSESEQLKRTFKQVYTDNNYSCSDWDEQYEINIGSYNGEFDRPMKKFSGVNNKSINTLFDADGKASNTTVRDPISGNIQFIVTDNGGATVAGPQTYDEVEPEVHGECKTAPVEYQARMDRVERLRLVTDRDHPWDYGDHTIRQNPINENKEWVTGDAYVFYTQILDWTRPTMEDGMNQFEYRHENEECAVFEKSGVLVDAPYSDAHDKINNIVVHDPVSVDRAMLISLPAERDQRIDGSVSSAESMLDKLAASQVCPGTAALCEFRHLNCKYFNDTVEAEFRIQNGKLYNPISGVAYTLPSGFSVDSDGQTLICKGTRLSIPLTDLGLTYNGNLQVAFEADVTFPEDAMYTMLFSFNRYDLYLTEKGLTFNTGNSVELYNPKVVTDGVTRHIKAVFDFGDIEKSELYIDNVRQNLIRANESKELNQTMVGNTFNIGSWNYDNKYPANFKLKNLKVTKLAGRSEHNKSCYTEVEVHSKVREYLCDHTTRFNYTGGVQTYTAPESGYYKIETYGAQGGSGYTAYEISKASKQGLGGYATGTVYLAKGQKVNVYVGGQGKSATSPNSGAGWNGGGQGRSSSAMGYGGGGASDIRTARVYTLNDKMKETGTITYGPYIDLDAGTYNVTVYGSGLTGVTPDFNTNGKQYTLSNVKKANNKLTYTVTIPSDLKGTAEFRVHHNRADYKFDRVEITSSSATALQNRVIVAGGGGGADDAGGIIKGFNDGSGGVGGGLTAGSGLIDGVANAGAAGGTQTSGYAKGQGQNATTVTDTGGAGGGYWGGRASNHNNGGAGGGSSFINGSLNGYTLSGVRQGDGQVIITPLDPKHSGSCKAQMTMNNTHVHTPDCISSTNQTLVGAFIQDFEGNSGPLKELLGNTVYQAYKNSQFNQDTMTGQKDFNYTGGVQTFTAPITGEYTFNVYGAQGGGATNDQNAASHAGLGGHVQASKIMNANETIYVYVGGQGTYANAINQGGGWNGGGQSGPSGYGGGGMSHISTVRTDNISSWNKYWTTERKELSEDKTYEFSTSVSGSGTYVMGEFTALSGGTMSEVAFYTSNRHMYTFQLREKDTQKLVAETPNFHSGSGGSGTTYMHNVTLTEGKVYQVLVTSGCGNFRGTCRTSFKTKGGYKTIIEHHFSNGTYGSFNTGAAWIVAGGGGGADNAGGTFNGGDDGSGGNGGNPATGGRINGAVQSGTAATQTSGYARGAGESAKHDASIQANVVWDAGGAGAGWYGGKSTHHYNGGGGGGSSYASSAVGNVRYNLESRKGNGFVRITWRNTGSLTLIHNAIDWIAKNYVNSLPQLVNGSKNPAYSCVGRYNKHVCDTGCRTEKMLTCSEPHHMDPMAHYPGTNPICWDPCGHTDPNDPNNPHTHKDDEAVIDGVTERLGTFVNLDYGFEIYFPNIGDFSQDEGLHGISAPTDVRGMSYVNDMDVTKWTREKRIRFEFDVLFNNPITEKWEQYKANSWISLPILEKDFTDYDEFTSQEEFADNAIEVYEFYCLLNNNEASASKISYECEAINAAHSPGGKEEPYERAIKNRIEERNIDNTTYTTNRLRNTVFKSKHSASKMSYVDVVGRIGNLFVTDTDDLRFCNFFKMPTDDGWVIEGIVKTVNEGIQNNYLSWHDRNGKAYKDIRGEIVKPETGMYNTWLMQPWLEDKDYMAGQNKVTGSTSVDLPLSAEKNNISQLLKDPLKPGYDVLFEISTIGMYTSNMQVIPYFYALDLDKNVLTPVDVYMTVDNEFVPINYYDILPRNTDSEETKKQKEKVMESLYDYVMNLEWSAESVRRNYSQLEKVVTGKIAEMYVVGVEGTDEAKLLDTPDTMVGFKYALGTVQLMNAEGYARTFIGSTYTQREEFNDDANDGKNTGDLNFGGGDNYTNLDNLTEASEFWYKAQRWHLKVGLPSSVSFVKYYEDGVRHKPTDVLKDKMGNPITDKNGVQMMNYEEIKNGNYAILMTTELTSYGNIWTLGYSQEGMNGSANIGGKHYEFGDNYNGQEIKGTIIAIYDASETSNVDIDILGTH